MDHLRECHADVLLHARKMWEAGLVVASAGNVSRRVDEHRIAITPTSVPYEVLTVDDISTVDLDSGLPLEPDRAPSYELPMHLSVYRARPEVGAIVHTHAPYVSTLAVLQRPLPPVIDEMVLYFGGTVAVTEYTFTGTYAVGDQVVRALSDHTGVILANHGNVCVGRDLKQAMHVAIVMEACARVYINALQIGEPVMLPPDAIAAGRRLFEQKYKLA